jgi:hypothetical protein
MKVSLPLLVLACLGTLGGSVLAQVTLSPLTSFGGGDGWLAPGENAFLTTNHTERGIAYSEATNHLYLVSRSSGTAVRILDGLTGSDLGGLNTTGITGGTFALNKIVVDPNDGSIFGANLRTGTTATTFKLYHWGTEGSAPSVIFDFLPDATGRIGDNLDLIGTGANAQIVAGYGTAATAANSNGYLVIEPIASASSPTAPAFNNITFAEGAGGTNDGDFRLGITFLAASDADSGIVLGTQGTSVGSRLTGYSGALDDRSSLAGTLFSSLNLTATTERAFDYLEFAGMELLATVDTSTSMVRLYDFSDPTVPVLLASLNNTTGAAIGNSNSGGDVRFGDTGVDVNNLPTVTLYAMNTNNGIQGFVVTIPEPSAVVMLGIGLCSVAARRRRI